MGREDYDLIATIARDIEPRFREARGVRHSTLTVFLVHLWACAHDRCVDWACQRSNWDARRCRWALPDQSTMSRRTRHESYERFKTAVEAELRRRCPQMSALNLRLCLDGSALQVAPHSGDTEATWGPTYGRRKGRGYRLHVIWQPMGPLPTFWRVEPMNRDERVVASELFGQAGDLGQGYVLADGKYDDSELYDLIAKSGRRLLSPRARPYTRLGHHYQSPWRLRAIETLEMPKHMGLSESFGWNMLACRKAVERSFAHLRSRAGLLSHLPMWVRGLRRVRQWVGAKLLLNAARHLRKHTSIGEDA
jgi:Transposase DDE domain